MFFTAKYDRIFRAVFIDEDDHELLEALLSCCLNTQIKIIKLLKTELSVNSSKERVKRLDLLVETKDDMINLELNTNFNIATKVRNLNYFTSFYSFTTNIGNNYDSKTGYIHIDLFYGMSLSKPCIDEFYLYSKQSHDFYVDNFKIVMVNMDKIMKFWYDGNEKMIKQYDLLIMLNLEPNDLNKLLKISDNKKLIKKYKDKVCKLNEDYDFLAPISAEQDYIMLMNTEKQLAVEEGFNEGYNNGMKQGMKKGLEQGIEQGSKKRNLEIIQNMIKVNFTKEQILTYLDISEEEYNKLMNNKKSH